MNLVTQIKNTFLGMSTSQFTLVYDGVGLRDGEMDVRELAPALLGVGKLLEDANRELNHDRANLSVRVKAGFKQGSFVIDLSAQQNIIEQIVGLIKHDPLVETAALVTIIFGGRGLFDLLKRGKGEKPKSVTKLENGNVQMVFNHSEVIVTNNVYHLYQSPDVRKGVRPVVRPLESPGIENLKAIQDKELLGEVKKGDLLGLTQIEMDERILDESQGTRVLQIVSLSFKEDNMWRLSEGGSEDFYSIEDAEFKEKIERSNERFGKNDILKCTVKITTRLTADGSLRTERAILKVLEHIAVARQASLFPKPADQL